MLNGCTFSNIRGESYNGSHATPVNLIELGGTPLSRDIIAVGL